MYGLVVADDVVVESSVESFLCADDAVDEGSSVVLALIDDGDEYSAFVA